MIAVTPGMVVDQRPWWPRRVLARFMGWWERKLNPTVDEQRARETRIMEVVNKLLP